MNDEREIAVSSFAALILLLLLAIRLMLAALH
jgi:hypothetical protein